MRPPDVIDRAERWGWAGFLTAYFCVGYFSIQAFTPPTRHADLSTRFDQAAPFVPAMAWAYLWALPAAFIPVFVVTRRALLRSTALAYFIAMTVSFLCFHAYPQSAIRLRPSSATLLPTRAGEWLVANIYAVDPPGNLFPSLHLSITALSAAAAWKADRRIGALAFVGLGLVATAACLVKQHFIADVLGGLALAAIVAPFTIGRLDESDVEVPPRPAGAKAFLAFAAIVYLAIFGAFAGGFSLRRCPDVTGACPLATPAAPTSDAPS